MLGNHIHEVVFADQTKLQVNVEELYDDQIIDARIAAKFDGKIYNGIPTVASSSLTAYTIKDEKSASKAGLERMQASNAQSLFILESLLHSQNKFPFYLVGTFNTGLHYQGLIVLFKPNKRLDIRVINSIARSEHESKEEIHLKLRDELNIFTQLGYHIDNLSYQEHILQINRHDCGVVTLENLEHALANQNIEPKSKRLTKEESIILRAKQAYEFKFKKPAPDIFSIDDKIIPSINKPSLGWSSNNPVAKAEMKSIQPIKNISEDEEIQTMCSSLFSANKEQAQKLTVFIKNRGNKSLDTCIAELVSLYFNLNENIDRLIGKLNELASNKPK